MTTIKESFSPQKKKMLHDGHRDRMREAVKKDPDLDSFSDFETLELLLSFFVPRKDTNEMAHDLIDEFGSLYGVLTAEPQELFQIKNVTQSASYFIPNLISFVRKAELSRRGKNIVIENVAHAVAVLRPYFIARNHERLYMVSLDINDRIIDVSCISKGIGNLAVTDINSITAKVSRSQAVKIIIAHNHPAGTLTPSIDDIRSTQTIATLLKVLGKQLIDHIIFSKDSHYSMYECDDLREIFEDTKGNPDEYLAKEVSTRLYPSKYVLEEKEVRENDVNTNDVLLDDTKSTPYPKTK
ncbi:MAG: hypothetical protein FWE03_05530 [Firmicutes bacterium]|nr:hypothetical protein [Bacillota bacterium]